jgi:hypothetical protein
MLKRIGTAIVALAMLGGGALVLWNLFGQGPYGDTCNYSLGCKSFLCIHHQLSGSAQWSAPGRCTKSCDTDAECGSGASCVVLGDEARSDLPPFGKPNRACLLVRESDDKR